ncbi:MAG: rRNA pseudouridine synthase [Bacilli bacterium]|nr:rRNA pseudouridine synthase [Bacilli bacterium]
MRLDRYLSNAGLASRSEIKHFFKDKRVLVNDQLVRQGKTQIDPNKDIIKVDNEVIKYKPFYYFVLNKPKGYVSANEDDKYPTIMEFFSDLNIKGLTHVGRLDKDTTGVLLITNDGKLGHFLISPKSNVKKIYSLTVDKDLDDSLVKSFKEGIILENKERCRPAKLTIINKRKAMLELTEGKYHQVKRMMRSVGYEVIDLNRDLFAFLTIKNLKPGEYYELNEEEINKLNEYLR